MLVFLLELHTSLVAHPVELRRMESEAACLVDRLRWRRHLLHLLDCVVVPGVQALGRCSPPWGSSSSFISSHSSASSQELACTPQRGAPRYRLVDQLWCPAPRCRFRHDCVGPIGGGTTTLVASVRKVARSA